MITTRAIPGTIAVKDRKFLYVRAESYPTFKRIFRDIGDWFRAGKSPMPSSGGMINENTEIRTPAGAKYFGFSFRGDLVAWENGILEFAADRGAELAAVAEGRLIHGNDDVDLTKCEIILECTDPKRAQNVRAVRLVSGSAARQPTSARLPVDTGAIFIADRALLASGKWDAADAEERRLAMFEAESAPHFVQWTVDGGGQAVVVATDDIREEMT